MVVENRRQGGFVKGIFAFSAGEVLIESWLLRASRELEKGCNIAIKAALNCNNPSQDRDRFLGNYSLKPSRRKINGGVK
jgi:hypothetical protein